MKYFIVADVHGYFNEMKTALNKAGFDPKNPTHVFVSLGDLFDRGSQPMECLNYVMSLPSDRRIFIRGNHEDLLENIVRQGIYNKYDLLNGTVQTIHDMAKNTNLFDAIIDLRANHAYNQYIYECRNFYDTNKYVFVHGWIPVLKNNKMSGTSFSLDYNWRNAPNSSWCAARWYNGMEMWYYGVRDESRTIVCGHWHTSWGHCYINNTQNEWPPEDASDKDVKQWFKPFSHHGIVALDACTVLSHVVNCYTITDNETKIH